MKLLEGRTPGIRASFAQKVSQLHANWLKHYDPNQSLGLGNDLPASDVLLSQPTKAEEKQVNLMRHTSLLYGFRCKLVHEFREPGYGMEAFSDELPHYHSMTDLDDSIQTIELVYPTEWFVRLPISVLKSLKTHYLNAETNPYESYDFDSLWC
jgi:hypothetical protein